MLEGTVYEQGGIFNEDVEKIHYVNVKNNVTCYLGTCGFIFFKI